MEVVAANETVMNLLKERRGRYVVRRTDGIDVNGILEQILLDPDDLYCRGQIVDSGRPGVRRDCLHITVAGQDYFIKRYNCIDWRYRFRHLFRPSRALRSWRAGWALLRAGVPTPVPQLCLEERTFRLLGSAYLVCAGLPGSVQFLELWPRLSSSEQKEALKDLAVLIGRMHWHRIIHGDINWRNILVRSSAEKPTYYFVDLDGSRRVSRLKACRAERDIGHFIRDLRRCGGDQGLENLFLEQWRSAAGFPKSALQE
jgi:tRNA A-37 threonylcarbamoyl transferase component Bud32